MTDFYGRGVAVGFMSEHGGVLEAVVSAKEISDFADRPDPRAAAKDYAVRQLDGWRKHFPNENLHVVEIAYDKCSRALYFDGWKLLS